MMPPNEGEAKSDAGSGVLSASACPAQRSVLRRCVDAVLPGLLISIVMLAAILGGAEWLLRSSEPFRDINWPSRFDPGLWFHLRAA